MRIIDYYLKESTEGQNSKIILSEEGRVERLVAGSTYKPIPATISRNRGLRIESEDNSQL